MDIGKKASKGAIHGSRKKIVEFQYKKRVILPNNMKLSSISKKLIYIIRIDRTRKCIINNKT
jgi:hypothetical protein